MIIQDQLGRKVELDKVPERIISLVPSQTELLVDLGLIDQIVGITNFCVHPKELKNIKTSVGGTKKVNFRKIRDLKPDIFFCNKEENTPEMIEELQKIAPVHISDVSNLKEAYKMISQYGHIFSRELAAQEIIDTIEKKVLKMKELKRPRKRVAYFIWKKPFMVAGRNNFIDAMLALNNLENVIQKSRYPVVDLKELPQIDLCLLSTEPFPFSEKDKKNFNSLNCQIEIVNGEYFSWYGSRLIKAMDYFKNLNIH
ncbi:helical backbone metal receptor [Gramella sp. AN32]|uniref:ABC transporter substrate-binding protein n=1 Tax=Christiangramia antarctica TaxID=2058158 RepID=A0ABW5X5I1_9FLAO|nr:helical backbone metal receptor [Gramella sp. AN32]MCM4158040.1 cobalamin-binding protein [Gramella sp. AN32]